MEGKPFLHRFSVAMAPHPSAFAPLLFAGKLEQGLEALSRAGFAGVEISLRGADDLDAKWLAERLAENGLVVSAIASGRVCLEDSLCLSDPRPAIRDRVLERLTAILQLAAAFRAPLIIGGVRGRLAGEEARRAEQRACAVESLQRCAGIAEELGIHLLLEPINRYETNFINSAQEGLDLIEAAGRPGIKLLLDTFHMNIEEADLGLAIRKAGDRLGYVHFADSNRRAPGQGHVDFRALVRVLAEVGYRGFISAEILPLPDDATALAQTAHYLHDLASEELVSAAVERK